MAPGDDPHDFSTYFFVHEKSNYHVNAKGSGKAELCKSTADVQWYIITFFINSLDKTPSLPTSRVPPSVIAQSIRPHPLTLKLADKERKKHPQNGKRIAYP